MTRCTSCGYQLDIAGETLCFPCLLRGAKVKMSGHPLPAAVPVGRVKPNFSQGSSKQQDTRAKQQDQRVIAALAALSRPGKSPVKLKKQTQAAKANRRGEDSTPRQRGGLKCILCGVRVPKGDLLKHKADVHGEMQVTPSPVRSKGTNAWVSVYQGGLPGLGKRH